MMTFNQRATATSALDAILQRDQIMNPSLFKKLLTDTYPELSAENVNAVLDIFESILTSVTSESWDESADLPDWAVIKPTGKSNTSCAKKVLATASDKSNRFKLGWQNSYKLKESVEVLLNYYQNCQHTTKLGVLITNVWRPGELSLYSSDIDAFELNGIQSVALIASGTSLLPICWPWR